MKNILILMISVVSLASCDNFIDLDPISDPNANSFYKDGTDMEQALNAAYNSLQSVNEYGGIGFASFMEVSSDNTWNTNTTQNGGAYAAFDNFLVDPTNTQLESTWATCYNGIYNCNIVINRINALNNIDEDKKKQMLGEALFLRALTYFNMVRMWGDVPLITKESNDVNEAFKHTRESSEKVYQQIISDLKSAAEALPISYDDANVGRVTKGAAQTLLSKVYLTRNDWTSASALLKSIISSGTYELLPNFSDVFSVDNKNNKESIFEVQFDKTIEGEGYSGGDPLQIGSDVNNLPSQNLINLFNENPDDRKDASIKDMGVQGVRMYKWHDSKGPYGTMGFDIIVLRYADVLLMASEALNEIKYGSSDALNYLNEVRKRSHAKPYTYQELSDQENFRNAVAKERRLELAFENSRWFDLVRTGKAVQTINKNNGGSVLNVNIDEHQTLFPIPQAEIDASGSKLTQNKGY